MVFDCFALLINAFMQPLSALRLFLVRSLTGTLFCYLPTRSIAFAFIKLLGFAQSAAAKCAIWSACAFTNDGRAVARAT